jgi:DNA-binding CsgD family transcriptional regulator
MRIWLTPDVLVKRNVKKRGSTNLENASIFPHIYVKAEVAWGNVENLMASSNVKRERRRELASALRDSGIPFVGELPWGMHICLFHETKLDLLDAAAAYFKAGLENNEFCIWAISQPISTADAIDALRKDLPDFDRHLADRRVEFLSGPQWYREGTEFDPQRIIAGWHEKLSAALAKGYEGMRVIGNAFWIGTDHWNAFFEYEHALHYSLAGQKMIVLCTYPLGASRSFDILDVARAHGFSIARRNGEWEYLEAPEPKQATRTVGRNTSVLDILPAEFPGRELLTPREITVLAHILRGSTNKEAARKLAVSPRTIEFHRANILSKLSARNTTELVHVILRELSS